ncbi:MAG: hypothetical protein CSB55_08690 [Candidatus Cloacimonadota bacterium]|nr:MAG: hypothetical protein CSB55_08690 [Candidatus Cloacimonadota bacterium]
MKRKETYLLFFIDIFIVALSYIFMSWIKSDDLAYRIYGYKTELSVFILVWLFISSVSSKYTLYKYHSIKNILSKAIEINFSIVALFTVFFFLFKQFDYSRILFFGSVSFITVLECLVLVFLGKNYNKKNKCTLKPVARKQRFMRSRKTLGFMIVNIFSFVLSFLLVAWYKPATVNRIIPQYRSIIFIMSLIWVFISLLTKKYHPLKGDKFGEAVQKIFIADIVASAVFCILIFGFKLFNLSRLIIFGTSLITLFLEFIFAFFYILSNRFRAIDPIDSHFDLVTHSDKLENIEEETVTTPVYVPDRYDPKFEPDIAVEKSFLRTLINEQYHYPDELFEFIYEFIAIENIGKSKCFVFNTGNSDNLDNFESSQLEMFLNLRKLNDMRRINKYLIKLNEILTPGGIFVGCGETIAQRRSRFVKKSFKLLGETFYVFDFIFNRVFPKLNLLQGLYFSVTKGMNRPLSKCEILGRLYFCGFEVIETKELNGKLFFLAKKSGKPSQDTNPSYGPLFKMKRHGKGGKIIHVYKFRTMHPYAEYLQHYMVERYGYGNKGKIENDFRTAEWGRWMRRLWLDELPQLINFLKGDMALVGVRPLSNRFLNEYPPELKEKRFKYKPGCIPPYVALKMQEVEEYLESERIYLNMKEEHPVWTDIKIFFIAVYNILANKIRSE